MNQERIFMFVNSNVANIRTFVDNIVSRSTLCKLCETVLGLHNWKPINYGFIVIYGHGLKTLQCFLLLLIHALPEFTTSHFKCDYGHRPNVNWLKIHFFFHVENSLEIQIAIRHLTSLQWKWRAWEMQRAIQWCFKTTFIYKRFDNYIHWINRSGLFLSFWAPSDFPLACFAFFKLLLIFKAKIFAHRLFCAILYQFVSSICWMSYIFHRIFKSKLNESHAKAHVYYIHVHFIPNISFVD